MMLRVQMGFSTQWSDDPDDKPSASPSAVSIAQQHYDPSREVVLRSEFLPERQFKVHLRGIVPINTAARPRLLAEPLTLGRAA